MAVNGKLVQSTALSEEQEFPKDQLLNSVKK